jgi:hypothetical protein
VADLEIVPDAEATTPSTKGESDFSAYLRTENAREKQGLPPSQPAPSPDPPEPVETALPEAADGAGKPAPTETAAPDRDETTGQFKKRDRVQERIDRAVAAQRAAERERDELRAWRQQVEAASSAAPPAPPVSPEPAPAPPDTSSKPKLENFVSRPDLYPDAWEAYNEALIDWKADQKMAAWQQQQQQQAAEGDAIARINQHTDEGRETYADWNEALNDDGAQVMLPGHVLEAIHASDQAPHLVYYLSRHADEARAIAAAAPYQALLMLGALTARSVAPPPAQPPASPVSRAKPPVKPVGATPTAPEAPNPNDLAFGPEYIRQMNALERKQKAARGF